MVFANLGPQEREAFFSLLDEYFASRPEILSNNNNGGRGGHDAQTAVAVAASSAVREAVVKHPEATARFMSAGLKHLAAGEGGGNGNNNRPTSGGGRTVGSGAGEPEEETTSVAGRIAAAQAMFSGKHSPFSKHGSTKVEQSSSPPPAPPPSYGLKSSSFAPPPVRRTPSSATPNTRLPPPPVKEENGEWVEALYDYESGEAGDLTVREGQRILLVERTSDDWWTGELNGNKGLIPASYVKLL